MKGSSVFNLTVSIVYACGDNEDIWLLIIVIGVHTSFVTITWDRIESSHDMEALLQ